jgi:phosphatidylglycerol---prolipoprotein diacylglyceryl transferase
MIDFLHNYVPQPVAFTAGQIHIHWYALLMIVGGLLGYFVTLFLAKKENFARDIIDDLLPVFVLGAIIGARIYYVLYAWEFYKDNLIDILKIWEGGLAIHGILGGGFIATYLFCRVKKISFLQLADLIVPGLALAQTVGRVGNYFNQEIFGRPTELPWGIPIEFANRPWQFSLYEYFHPVFLYESFGNLIIFITLLLLWRRQLAKFPGNIFLVYIFLYSLQRFFLEFLRVDYSPEVFGIRWAQLLSGFLMIFVLTLIIAKNRKIKIISE